MQWSAKNEQEAQGHITNLHVARNKEAKISLHKPESYM